MGCLIIYLYIYADLVQDGALVRYGSSGIQTSTRRNMTPEKRGGWCTWTPMCLRVPVNCELISWSEWNTSDRNVCIVGQGTHGSFRNKTVKELCWGDLHLDNIKEAKFSHRKAVECQLNPWFEWDDCTRTSWIVFWMPLAFLRSALNRPFLTILPCYSLCKMAIYATFQKRFLNC